MMPNITNQQEMQIKTITIKQCKLLADCRVTGTHTADGNVT